VLLVLFVWWEQRVEDPMVKLELFRIRNFSIANVIAMIIAFGMLGIFFPMTLFLQQALGYSPIRAGLTMTPMSLMILVAAPMAGRMTDRIGPRWILVTGTSLMAVGILFIIQSIDVDTTPLSLAPSLVVAGLGMGMTFSPMTAAAMRDVPQRIAGSASGILNTMRNIGQVLGIAILGSYLQNRIGFFSREELAGQTVSGTTIDEIASMASQNQFLEIAAVVPAGDLEPIMEALAEAFVSAIHSTFFVGAMSCLLAAVAAFMLRNPAPRRVSADMEARRETARSEERQPAVTAD
jgi:MFS family permease